MHSEYSEYFFNHNNMLHVSEIYDVVTLEI